MTTKRRIALPPNVEVHNLTVAPHVKLGDPVPGAVSLVDKLKGYYKGLIALVAAIVAILNQLSPLGNFLPAPERGYLTSAIVVVGVVLTFLKDNEHYVDDV